MKCAAAHFLYAKVDLPALHRLAQAWPGGGAMKTLRQAVNDYLMMRRGLGFKLYHVERDLEIASSTGASV
jgi:hypothetical protein